MKLSIAIAATIVATLPAHAEVTSAYTKYDLEKCAITKPGNETEGFSPTYRCNGVQGIDIIFAEGDLRAQVGFGSDEKSMCSLNQSFPRFNSVNNTVEWRLRDGKVFAAIQRWTVAFGDEATPQNRTWLLVSKIEGDLSCAMIAVEGAMPKANERARAAADVLSANFSCTTDDILVLARSGIDTSETMAGPACVKE